MSIFGTAAACDPSFTVAEVTGCASSIALRIRDAEVTAVNLFIFPSVFLHEAQLVPNLESRKHAGLLAEQ